MRVTRIKISNVLGIEALEFTPGALTLVHGANETGKTSVLEAIRAVMDNAPTAELVRHGAEKGEVVLVLEDGTEIKRTFTHGNKSGALQVRHPEFGAIGKAQSYVDRLLGALNANPLRFIQAEPKERVKLLIEALPVHVTTQEVHDAVKLNVGMVDETAHALVELDRLHKWIYETRTEQNAIVRDKTTLVEQLNATIPPGFKTDAHVNFANVITSYENRLGEVRTHTADEVTDIRNRYDEQAAALTEDLDKSVAEIRAEIDALRKRESALVEERRLKHYDLREIMNNEIHQAHTLMDAAVAELQRKIEETHSIERAQIAALRTKEIIAQAQTTLDDAHQKASRCSLALSGIVGLKERKINESSLPGVEIKDGDVYYKGTVFHRLNTATQFSLAIQIAIRTAGGLPFICLDGAEALDAENFKLLEQEVTKTGVQVITARVDKGPLAISTGTTP